MGLLSKIEISTNHGDRIVDAYKHGKFIVHLPPGQTISDNPDYAPDRLWVVSHRATGLQVTVVWGRAAARRMARALDAATKADVTKEDYQQKTAAWHVFRKAVAGIVKRD